jgi:5-methylcytosine-specific restriction endonuclease McrA
MCVVGEYKPEDIMALYGDHDAIFYAGDFPYSVHMDSLRYRTFIQSLECCVCGLRGSVMRLEYSYHQRGQLRPHFNLYAINPENGTYVLMTKDHIIPVSKDGTDAEDNLQTMCSPCNAKKGNKLHASSEDRKEPRLLLAVARDHESGDAGDSHDTTRVHPYRVHRPLWSPVLVAGEQPCIGSSDLVRV